MQTKVQKWDNNLGVRIPHALANQICLREGSVVEIEERDGTIVIRQVASPTYTLDELVDEIAEDNRHSEIDTGAPTGNEVW